MLNASKTEIVAEIVNGPRNDAVLVPCKAARLSWETVETILQNRPGAQGLSAQVLELAQADYRRLSVQTAQKALRFMQVRAAAS